MTTPQRQTTTLEKQASPVERIRGYHAELREIRRDLHAHPELAFEESRTSSLVAEKLAGWGIEVHRGLAKTGVVGVIKGKRAESGKGVGLRADMDCLPMHEAAHRGQSETQKSSAHGQYQHLAYHLHR